MPNDCIEIWINLFKKREDPKKCSNCRYFYYYPNLPMFHRYSEDDELCGFDNHYPTLREIKYGCDNWSKDLNKNGWVG